VAIQYWSTCPGAAFVVRRPLPRSTSRALYFIFSIPRSRVCVFSGARFLPCATFSRIAPPEGILPRSFIQRKVQHDGRHATFCDFSFCRWGIALSSGFRFFPLFLSAIRLPTCPGALSTPSCWGSRFFQRRENEVTPLHLWLADQATFPRPLFS